MNEDRMGRRSSRSARQSLEIEENQESLRRSIAATGRLVSQSEDMLRRHRRGGGLRLTARRGGSPPAPESRAAGPRR
jgi:hypothetical protein